MKRNLPSFLDLYRTLIATPSVSATDSDQDQSNAPLIHTLADWLETCGFQTEISAVPHSRNKLNLVARLGEGDGGLLLAGHTDTVPFDADQWHTDPFTLTERDDKLYGLGTADMKGFFAFVLEAVRELDRGTLRRPLTLLATADEEITMAGARHFAETTTLRPDCAIIGEPTSLRPIRAHKGHVSEAIRVTGKSGHSSDPARGINAIEIMHAVIGQLLKLRDTLKTHYHHVDFVIPYPTMNLGHIHGGDAVNRICACCELHLDIRPLPGLQLDTLRAMLTEALAPLSAQWPDRIALTTLHAPIPGYECAADHPFVQTTETLIGARAETVNYCTEAPFIQTVCPTLILGPGSIEQAHQPDEYLAMSMIKPGLAQLRSVIRHFCGH